MSASNPLLGTTFDRSHVATFWTQQSAPGVARGAVARMSTTAPTVDPWNYVMVEVLR